MLNKHVYPYNIHKLKYVGKLVPLKILKIVYSSIAKSNVLLHFGNVAAT